MKSQHNESISFNILNCQAYKQRQPINLNQNSLVNQRLNIPLLSLKTQLEKSPQQRPKLFRQVNQQPNLYDESQNTQVYKFKTSTDTYDQFENNRKQQSIINKDFQRERAFTNYQIHIRKPEEVYSSKTESVDRDIIYSRPKQFEQDFRILQNYQSHPHRQITTSSQHNKINKIQISINSSKNRSHTINEIPYKGNNQQKTIFNTKFKMKLVVKKLRLKIIVIFVRAALRFSKKYKNIFLKRNQALAHFNKLKKPHLTIFNTIGSRQVQQQYRNFVEQIFSKMIKLLQSSNYIKDYTDILQQNKEMILDFQKQRLCFFIKLILLDLELITRKKIIPGIIQHCLNLCLFQDKNTQTSQFVVNRTKFYSKTVHSLTQEQKVLIAYEFLIFTIIIPNLITIANEQMYTNVDHQAIIQIYFLAIVMLFTSFFTNLFKGLPKIESSNVKPIQLTLKVCEDEEDKPVKAQLIISPNIEINEDMIISGPLKLNFVDSVFSEKPTLKNQMCQVFQKIAHNIGALIDISNPE